MSIPRKGPKLKAFRKEHGLNQKQLGALLAKKLPQSKVSLIETNKGGALTAEDQRALRAWVRRRGGARGGGGGPRVNVPRTKKMLASLRRKLGMSQGAFAKQALGLSQPYYSQIERGERALPVKARQKLGAWLRKNKKKESAAKGRKKRLPWNVPATGEGLGNLLERMAQAKTNKKKFTPGAIATGTGLKLASLKQYIHLKKLPKKFIAKLKSFLAKHA